MRTCGHGKATGRHGLHRRQLFMIHGYITAGCHGRGGRVLGPSIVHYLGAFDLFSTLYFRLGLFLVCLISISRRTCPSTSIPYRQRTAYTTHDNDYHPAETRTRRNIDERRGYHTNPHLISHLTHTKCSADRERRVSRRAPRNRSPLRQQRHGTRVSPSVDPLLPPFPAADHLAPPRTWRTLLESGYPLLRLNCMHMRAMAS